VGSGRLSPICVCSRDCIHAHPLRRRPPRRLQLPRHDPSLSRPHHTISDVELIGGGHIPMLGEVPLAHPGMLFLGELSDLRRHVLESLC
jgi:predicted ATPase with chaperone activity